MIHVFLKNGEILSIFNPDKITASDIIKALCGDATFLRICNHVLNISEITRIEVVNNG